MSAIVTASHLTKRFGSTEALKEISFALQEQRIVGLIGQNGSGKSTLLDLIVGNSIPTAGQCVTLGTAAAQLDESVLTRIGVVFQENRLLPWMRVDEHLRFLSTFYPRWDADRARTLIRDLEVDAAAKIGHLSGGNLQKLAILSAVCHRPRLLVLDEPVSALDPLAREALLQLIVRLLDEDDVTIIVSSHLLSDIERLVDWVLCLDEGELRANSSLSRLQQRFSTWRVTAPAREAPLNFDEPFIRRRDRQGDSVSIVVEAGAEDLHRFRDKYRVEVTSEPMSLEKIYPFLLKPRG